MLGDTSFLTEEILFNTLRVVSFILFLVFGILSIIRSALNKNISNKKRIFWTIMQIIAFPLVLFYSFIIERNKIIRLACALSFILFITYTALPTHISKMLAGINTQKGFNLSAEHCSKKLIKEPDPSQANDKNIAEWSVNISQQIMTFDHKNSEEIFDCGPFYFTPDGWRGFTESLKETRFIESVKKYHLSVTLQSIGTPEVQKTPVKNGSTTWFVQFPTRVAFMGDPRSGIGHFPPIEGYLFLRIEQAPAEQHSRRWGITQWILSPQKMSVPVLGVEQSDTRYPISTTVTS